MLVSQLIGRAGRCPGLPTTGRTTALTLILIRPSELPKLTLKIDADTYRGTRVGVPNLISQLRRHGAGATFLFSLGPDHTGWALDRKSVV